MSKHSRDVDAQYRAWMEQTYDGIAKDEDPLIREGIEFREFASKSNGKGRKPRRRWRDIGFLHYNGNVYSVHEDDIKASKNPSARKPDLLAEDILGDGATMEDLLEHGRKMQKKDGDREGKDLNEEDQENNSGAPRGIRVTSSSPYGSASRPRLLQLRQAQLQSGSSNAIKIQK